MATWRELSRESLSAAKLLRQSGFYRSSVSRSYYAAYAAFTAALADTKGVRFSHVGNNPAHEQLLTLVAHNLARKRLKDHQRRTLRGNLNRLWNLRVAADYVPRWSVGTDEARTAAMLAAGIVRDMESLG